MSGWRFHWGHADMMDPFGEGKLLIAQQQYGTDSFFVARPLELVKVENCAHIENPTLQFHGDREQFQQALMDSLWAEGVRPSEHNMTTGATERHLNDMRKIVGRQLDVDLDRR